MCFLQSVECFLYWGLRGIVEKGVQRLKAWVWDIKFERSKLVPLYKTFLNSKGNHITPHIVGTLPNLTCY